MPPRIPLTYLFDPLCGWCYGASAALDQIRARPDIALVLAPTGLFAGEGARPLDDGFATYAWANDQRIARLTGLPFSDRYRTKVLGDRRALLDSAPATLALTAVHLTRPDQEFDALKAMQQARYVDGRDNTDLPILANILADLGLHEAARRLTAPDEALVSAYHQRIAASRADMHAFNLEGVPALLVGEGSTRRRLKADALFGLVEALIADIRAQ
ncbi:DsbA family protein [Nitrospirillum pindoramense]|uniref:DSBA-like thioredoxin domain-containing protein n=1 Tax=Nitrospirillum amazonense TaxID=28077 RepID=A0A560HBP7_9PROT|nr:DsbA family protein [Nitrospirillum amazonense]TWB43782.1 putative protein-disulfide isomerase [Nitrospirillum amazonense]